MTISWQEITIHRHTSPIASGATNRPKSSYRRAQLTRHHVTKHRVTRHHVIFRNITWHVTSQAELETGPNLATKRPNYPDTTWSFVISRDMWQRLQSYRTAQVQLHKGPTEKAELLRENLDFQTWNYAESCGKLKISRFVAENTIFREKLRETSNVAKSCGKWKKLRSRNHRN